MKYFYWLLPCFIVIFSACTPNEPSTPGQDPNGSKNDGENDDTPTEIVKPKYLSHAYSTYTYMDETYSSIFPNGFNFEEIYYRKSDVKYIEQFEHRENGVTTSLRKYTNDGNKDIIVDANPQDGSSQSDTIIWADNDRTLNKEVISGNSRTVYIRDNNDLTKLLDVKTYVDNKLISHEVWKHSGNVAYVRADSYDYSTHELTSYNLDTFTYSNSHFTQKAKYWRYNLENEVTSVSEISGTIRCSLSLPSQQWLHVFSCSVSSIQ